jgi:sulfite exporter TauE/SafE
MSCCSAASDPTVASSLWLVFVMGLAGSAHCLGMCGPLVAAAESLRPGRWTPWAHLPMHAGRLLTYAVMGGIAGVVGETVNRGALAIGLQGAASMLGGIAMILFGLALAGWLPFRWGLRVGERASGRIASALASHRPLSGLVIGLYWGMLPCGLVWGALLYAGATGSPIRGALAMLVFGAGTVPALLVLGSVAGWIGARYRQALLHIGAVSVVAMGILLLLRSAAGAGWIRHLKLLEGMPLY